MQTAGLAIRVRVVTYQEVQSTHCKVLSVITTSLSYPAVQQRVKKNEREGNTRNTERCYTPERNKERTVDDKG